MKTLNWNISSDADKQVFNPSDIYEAGLFNHHIANTAYPIAHITTMKSYRANTQEEIQTYAVKAWEWVEEMWLYVHIPFCEHRCAFCEYTVVDPIFLPTSEDLYFDLLIKEFEMYANLINTKSKKLVGFDIGGWTPSVAKIENIQRVLDAARKYFILPDDVIISIETTPKIAATQPEKLKAYYDMWIRRISMWVQTISAKVLEMVWRTNTTLEWNIKAVENIRSAWFDRFNIDIMYGMYGQNMENVSATLKHVLDLNPEFVTLYRTRYKWTKVSAHAANVELDDVNFQAEYLKKTLLEAWYEWQDGKNTFSKIKGDYGTSDYLTNRVIYGTPYLWLGLGAQSYSLKTLSYNMGAADKRLARYQQSIEKWQLPIQDIYYMSKESSIGKFVSVSFYFGGVHLPSFKNNFDADFEIVFKEEVKFVLENWLMYMDNDYIRLTPKWVEDYNWVISLFYAPAVKEYLLKKTSEEKSKLQATEKELIFA